MATKSLSLATTLCAALIGCATPPAGSPGDGRTYKAQHCNNAARCDVPVSVRCAFGNWHCSVILASDPLIVKSDTRSPNKLRWEIRTPGFEFDPAKGIQFVDDPENARKNEITNCRRDQQNKQVYTCDNRHTGFGVYKYSVMVTGATPLDPWVVNN